MSVEQTSQLIQLILNSVLMVAACAVVLIGLVVRQTTVLFRLRAAHQEYSEILTGLAMERENRPSAPVNDRLLQMRHQLRYLRQHYRTVHYGVLAAHYALLFCLASTLIITCRTLINSNWLITLALVLFFIGAGSLLLSIGLTLLSFRVGDRSPELIPIAPLSIVRTLIVKPRSRLKPSKLVRLPMRE